MRRVVFGLLVLGVIEPAVAADYVDDSTLRGSQSYEPGTPVYGRWSGVYGGAQGGAAIGSADFGNGVSGLVAYILRNTTLEGEAQPSTWTTLNKADVVGTSWGGFVGYNGQWENAVLGVELNYNHTSLTMDAKDSIARSNTLDDGYRYNTSITGAASIHVTDYATLRGRAGWVFDNFMPYGFAGLAVGRADVNRSAIVAVTAVDAVNTPAILPTVHLNGTGGADQPGQFSYGWALGAGVDIALLQNVFVRAEYEWVQFANFDNIKLHIGSFRGAVGLKF